MPDAIKLEIITIHPMGSMTQTVIAREGISITQFSREDVLKKTAETLKSMKKPHSVQDNMLIEYYPGKSAPEIIAMKEREVEEFKLKYGNIFQITMNKEVIKE